MKALVAVVLVLAVGVAVCFFVFAKADPQPVVADNGSSGVYTTFYPTTFFAETIAMGKVPVTNLCPEDEDPIFWVPDRQALQVYQQADLIVTNGAGFEKWLGKVSLPAERLVESTRDLSDPLIEFTNTTHAHGPAGTHAHEGIDGHTWVDPVSALSQAETIYHAMVERFPEHRRSFDEGFAALKTMLEDLDRQFGELRGVSTPVLCSHPAYNYIARRYEWNIRNLDLDPETRLTDEQLSDIRELLETFPAETLVWEGEPTPEVSEQVAQELGLVSVVFSPCELLSAEERDNGVDYMDVMNRNVEVMKKVFGFGHAHAKLHRVSSP